MIGQVHIPSNPRTILRSTTKELVEPLVENISVSKSA
jgi:hypothetical protein